MAPILAFPFGGVRIQTRHYIDPGINLVFFRGIRIHLNWDPLERTYGHPRLRLFAPVLDVWQQDSHGLKETDPKNQAVAHKTGTQNGTLVSANMDQTLRNPSCLILSHTHGRSRPGVCPIAKDQKPGTPHLLETVPEATPSFDCGSGTLMIWKLIPVFQVLVCSAVWLISSRPPTSWEVRVPCLGCLLEDQSPTCSVQSRQPMAGTKTQKRVSCTEQV